MKMGGFIINFLKNSSFEKKCGQKWDENFGKLIFANFFITSSIFLCQI